jgi:hypothetical protein
MQYHKAAHLGKQRAAKSQMRLFDFTGFAMLTYTIKQGAQGFEPVGEEELAGRLENGSEAMLFICDQDGYAKAQSKPLPLEKAKEIFDKMLEAGIPAYTGKIKTVS